MAAKVNLSWVQEGRNPWHLTIYPIYDKGGNVASFITMCGIQGRAGISGWSWNPPDGDAQRRGPFCTDCLGQLVDLAANTRSK